MIQNRCVITWHSPINDYMDLPLTASLANRVKRTSFGLNHIKPHPQSWLNSPNLEHLHSARTPRILANRRHFVGGEQEARADNIQTGFGADNGHGTSHSNLIENRKTIKVLNELLKFQTSSLHVNRNYNLQTTCKKNYVLQLSSTSKWSSRHLSEMKISHS